MRLVRIGSGLRPSARILWARITSRGGEVVRDVQGVRMKLDLSDVLRKLDVTIDYFRMDIEGFEVEVVKGMVETLTTSARPDGGVH